MLFKKANEALANEDSDDDEKGSGKNRKGQGKKVGDNEFASLITSLNSETSNKLAFNVTKDDKIKCNVLNIFGLNKKKPDE